MKRLGKGENQTWTPLKKKKKQHLNHCIYSYLFPQKSQGFLPLFKRKEKSSIPSHLKGMCTIKRVLTPMRYVETVIYKHIFHLFSFSMPEGKKKKTFTSNHSLLKYSGKKKKKRFSLEKGGGEEGTSKEKKKKKFKCSWTSI